MEGIGIGSGGKGVGLVTVLDEKINPKTVIFCIPTISMPHTATLESLEASEPLFVEAGWKTSIVFEIGCPYISAARNKMLRKALDCRPEVIVFIDHDLSWKPKDLLTLVETEGDVVAGTYRFKKEEEEYMGLLFDDPETHRPQVRESDGALRAELIPAGFLKLTPKAIDKFMKAYPSLCYGPAYGYSVDLFNHGAEDGRWYSEDYAFSRHWLGTGGEIWIVPNLDLAHHAMVKDKDIKFEGNFHEFLLRCPGGSKHQQSKGGHIDFDVTVGGENGATDRVREQPGEEDIYTGKAGMDGVDNARQRRLPQAGRFA